MEQYSDDDYDDNGGGHGTDPLELFGRFAVLDVVMRGWVRGCWGTALTPQNVPAGWLYSMW